MSSPASMWLVLGLETRLGLWKDLSFLGQWRGIRKASRQKTALLIWEKHVLVLFSPQQPSFVRSFQPFVFFTNRRVAKTSLGADGTQEEAGARFPEPERYLHECCLVLIHPPRRSFGKWLLEHGLLNGAAGTIITIHNPYGSTYQAGQELSKVLDQATYMQEAFSI